MADPQTQAVMRGLIKVWADFAVDLDTVPLIDKLMRGKFRIDDYCRLLINHPQQVIEGAGGWPCRTLQAGFRLMLHGLDAENLYGFIKYMWDQQIVRIQSMSGQTYCFDPPKQREAAE